MSMWYSPLSYIDVAGVYLSNPYLFDALILLTIFLGISQYVFTKDGHFGKKNGKPVAIAVSVALTISTIVFLYQRGWNLATPGVSIIPFTIIFIIFYYLLYTILTDVVEANKLCAGSIAFIFTYVGISSMFADVLPQVVLRYPLLELFISLLFLVAIGAFLACIGSIFTGIKNPFGGKDTKTGGNEGDDEPPTKHPRLQVVIDEPEGEYSTNDTIPLRARIVGGDGTYNWTATIETTRRGHRGAEANPKIDFPNPGAGNHRVVIIVESAGQRESARATFTVREDAQETITISGKAYIADEGRALNRALIILATVNARGERVLLGEQGRTLTATDGTYSFTVPNTQARYSIVGYWHKDNKITAEPEPSKHTHIGEIDTKRGYYSFSKLRERTTDGQPIFATKKGENISKLNLSFKPKEQEEATIKITSEGLDNARITITPQINGQDTHETPIDQQAPPGNYTIEAEEERERKMFSHWTIRTGERINERTLPVPLAHRDILELTAHYTQQQTIRVRSEDLGGEELPNMPFLLNATSMSTPTGELPIEGAEVTLEAQETDEYVFKEWRGVDSDKQERTITIDFSSDKTTRNITMVYEKNSPDPVEEDATSTNKQNESRNKPADTKKEKKLIKEIKKTSNRIPATRSSEDENYQEALKNVNEAFTDETVTHTPEEQKQAIEVLNNYPSWSKRHKESLINLWDETKKLLSIQYEKILDTNEPTNHLSSQAQEAYNLLRQGIINSLQKIKTGIIITGLNAEARARVLLSLAKQETQFAKESIPMIYKKSHELYVTYLDKENIKKSVIDDIERLQKQLVDANTPKKLFEALTTFNKKIKGILQFAYNYFLLSEKNIPEEEPHLLEEITASSDEEVSHEEKYRRIREEVSKKYSSRTTKESSEELPAKRFSLRKLFSRKKQQEVTTQTQKDHKEYTKPLVRITPKEGGILTKQEPLDTRMQLTSDFITQNTYDFEITRQGGSKGGFYRYAIAMYATTKDNKTHLLTQNQLHQLGVRYSGHENRKKNISDDVQPLFTLAYEDNTHAAFSSFNELYAPAESKLVRVTIGHVDELTPQDAKNLVDYSGFGVLKQVLGQYVQAIHIIAEVSYAHTKTDRPEELENKPEPVARAQLDIINPKDS
ncbi:MAG: hypothetical protein ACMXYD_00115 [Candidatus Woesearchaeota archaeon]